MKKLVSTMLCVKKKILLARFAIGQRMPLTSVGVSAADGGSSKP